MDSLPSIGDRYRDPMDLRVEDYDLLPELAKEAPIGAYFLGPGVDHQVTTYTLPPYVVEFELDREIPKYEPFVLTFSVNDPNSVADPEVVAASTTQAMRVGEDKFVYPTRGIDEVRGDIVGSTGFFYNFQSWLDIERDDGEVVQSELYDSETVYNNTKEKDEESRQWHITRATNYGRYSNKFEKDSDFFPTEPSPFSLVGTKGVGNLDSPVQNLWAVDYEITDTEARAASIDTFEYDKTFYNYTRNPAVQQHPIVDDVASQLRDICDRIDATQPIEQVRVVADFVQYFTHRDEGVGAFLTGEYPPGYDLSSHTHPVRTLYHTGGDCVSFAILGCTLLRTEYFDIEPEIAEIADTDIFTAQGREVGHVSMGIPLVELAIDDISGDSHISLVDKDSEIIDTLGSKKYTISKGSYFGPKGETMYVELSGELPLGAISTKFAGKVDSYS